MADLDLDSSLSLSSRRRSSAHYKPPSAPPSLPIPDPPRPSPNLAAVAAYSQSRAASVDDLEDPPPQSILTSSRLSSNHHHQQMTHHHLSVPDLDRPSESRSEHKAPSSRKALTRALELAREAVQLDSTNDNPELAVAAYAKSVALLSEVMERVRRGEDTTESTSRRKNGRRRSVVAQEEEVRRLQNIHDTYADRMNILSIIYSIPPPPHPASSYYSVTTPTTESAPSTSPTSSASPSSDTTDPIPSNAYTNSHTPDDVLDYSDIQDINQQDGISAIGAAMFDNGRTDISGLPSTTSHPYAIAHSDFSSSSAAPTVPTNRTSVQRRSRAPSSLPPPQPPPSISPPAPPAPVVIEPEVPIYQNGRHSDVTRQRGDSVISMTHRRTGSGSKLASLEEEEVERHENGYTKSRLGTNGSHIPSYDSPSLPTEPLPSVSLDSPGTPRVLSKPLPSPRLNSTTSASVSRPRGSSQISMRSEASSQSSQIINTSTNQGTIYQRRSKNSTSTRSSSPAESTASVGSRGVPTGSSASSSGGRSRSASQPGRRPSLVNGRVSPVEQRPPLPTGGAVPVPQRKPSYPQSPPIPPSAIVGPLTVQTDLLSNPHVTVMSVGVPITPTSPLPPIAPSDPLRKPYHLMQLLRTTMISSTGGYITRRLHVPQEVWSQGGAKLGNVADKVRVVDILCSALDELQTCSSEIFGAGNVSSGMALGIGSIVRKDGEAWVAKLEEFSTVCDGVVGNFGKKLGVGEGFVLKKTTWGDKLTRRFDKFTNGKNLDSPASYVQGLKKLFNHAQLLDEHTKAVMSQPVAPAYSALPMDIRSAADVKLRRASEFFASVVLTFVIRDLSQLLDKYAKKCEKWLAE
ncbi:hypothetical protein VKT23_005733 [Stygiomarasmius scandens]|uniref:MIT domain-containing protein n=1 Tax=Marasmiellus scandens TaxID=2682957 RepID=A0ABR1JRI2_9AGAR